MEILNFVADRVLSTAVTSKEVKQLVQELVENGYTLHEIDAAFTLIFSLPEMLMSESEDPLSATRAMRVFTPAERMKLAIGAQGYLLGLLNYGLLSSVELEEIVHAAMQLESDEVGVAEIKWLFPQVLSDQLRSALLATEKSHPGAEHDDQSH